MKPTEARLAHAEAALAELLKFVRPADRALSAYFRSHRQLGQQDRAFVAETSFAVLRRKRSLEAAAASAAPGDLVIAALVRVFGLSARALEDSSALVARIKAAQDRSFPEAVRADLPDWLWQRLVLEYGADEACAISQGLLAPAPLDLRVNLTKISREEALECLQLEASATPYSPAGVRLKGKPQINRHPLFLDGSVEVQDEGSKLLAYLLAPRRGEMVADFCAGAGGKTLALSMLMRGAGRVYAMDISARRLAELGPRAARAGASNVHSILLSGENDLRAKRLTGKLDRVLVDTPCSGFGTLRRNPDLKWRHDARAVAELAAKQSRILQAASKLLKPGGRLVYATCSLSGRENLDVVAAFRAEHREFHPAPFANVFGFEPDGAGLTIWPARHDTDGFFVASLRRQ